MGDFKDILNTVIIFLLFKFILIDWDSEFKLSIFENSKHKILPPVFKTLLASLTAELMSAKFLIPKLTEYMSKVSLSKGNFSASEWCQIIFSKFE